MKKLSLYILLVFIWCNLSVNANAVPKTKSGKGELFLSEKIIEGFYDYSTKPLSRLPLIFFISDDKQDFYTVIINQDGKGVAGSGYINKKIVKCQSKLKQKCYVFSNSRHIVWDNGINPRKGKKSKISSKISKEDLIIKLSELGFIETKEQKAAKEKKLAEKKVAKNVTWEVFVKLTGELGGNNAVLPGFNAKQTSKLKTVTEQKYILKKIMDEAIYQCKYSNVVWVVAYRGKKICTVTVVKYFDEENPNNNNKYVNLLGIKFDDLIITINGLENVTSEKIEDKAAKEKKLADAKAAKDKAKKKKKIVKKEITKEITPKNLDKITSIEEAQTTVNNIQSTINMYETINGVMAKQKNTRKNTYKEIIEKKIATLQKQKELLQTMLTTRFSTPIKPSNANLNVSAFRSAETYPKIPFYIPGTNEIGEMLVIPKVSDDGYLLYKLDFLDPTSEYDKVRDSISILHENIENVILGLQKIDEWTVVAQKNKLNRRISKTSICVPSDACKIKKQGVTSTEIIFQVYEDGSTSGRIQRNKGLFSVGYNMSVESTILMSSYLVYMQEVGAQEFKSGSMSDEQVESLFN